MPFSESQMFVIAALALPFGVYNLCDAFAGGFTRYSAPFPINLIGGIAGITCGLYFSLQLIGS